MSLSLTLPWTLGLLALLPLIAWLHRRRDPARRILVPSLQPWSILETQVAPRRRRVDGGWLLALHLLGAFGLTLGASGLRLVGSNDPLVILLDATPSMGAADRWPEALQAVSRQAAGRDGPVSLILLQDRPRLLVDRTGDPDDLAAALRDISPRAGQDLDRPPDLAGALEMAHSLGGKGDGGMGDIVVVSDGGLEVPLPTAAAQTEPNVTLTRVGKPADNWGIVAARVSRSGGAPRLFVRLAGRAAAPGSRSLRVTADGRQVADLELDLPAAGERQILLPIFGVEDLKEITVVLKGTDAQSADDRWQIAGPLAGRPVQVAGVSKRLTRLLRAWPDIAVIPTGTGRMRAADDLALSIVVGGRPAGTLPPGPVLLIGGTSAPGPAQPLSWPDPPVWLAPPVAEGLWVRPVLPGPEAGDHVLAWAGNRPVLAMDTEEGRRVVTLAIDPEAEELTVSRSWQRLLRWSVTLAMGGGDGPSQTAGDDAFLAAADDARAQEADLHQQASGWRTSPNPAWRFAWPAPWRVSAALAMIALLAEGALRGGRRFPRRRSRRGTAATVAS